MACAALLVAMVLVLFGDEPERLSSGRANPLAHLPMWTLLLPALGGLPFVLAVARRPRVAANHFALTVRPGWIRTLVLPWSKVEEVTTMEADGERYLFVRCREGADRMGNAPGWTDRGVLRELTRSGSRVGRRFDLAVRMRDFVGGVDGQIAALAAFAPDHVTVVNRLDG